MDHDARIDALWREYLATQEALDAVGDDLTAAIVERDTLSHAIRDPSPDLAAIADRKRPDVPVERSWTVLDVNAEVLAGVREAEARRRLATHPDRWADCGG